MAELDGPENIRYLNPTYPDEVSKAQLAKYLGLDLGQASELIYMQGLIKAHLASIQPPSISKEDAARTVKRMDEITKYFSEDPVRNYHDAKTQLQQLLGE